MLSCVRLNTGTRGRIGAFKNMYRDEHGVWNGVRWDDQCASVFVLCEADEKKAMAKLLRGNREDAALPISRHRLVQASLKSSQLERKLFALATAFCVDKNAPFCLESLISRIVRETHNIE
jgi:hypothetical protein